MLSQICIIEFTSRQCKIINWLYSALLQIEPLSLLTISPAIATSKFCFTCIENEEANAVYVDPDITDSVNYQQPVMPPMPEGLSNEQVYKEIYFLEITQCMYSAVGVLVQLNAIKQSKQQRASAYFFFFCICISHIIKLNAKTSNPT